MSSQELRLIDPGNPLTIRPAKDDNELRLSRVCQLHCSIQESFVAKFSKDIPKGTIPILVDFPAPCPHEEETSFVLCFTGEFFAASSMISSFDLLLAKLS